MKGEFKDKMGKSYLYGNCKYNPPTFFGESADSDFPTTSQNDFCSKYKKR